MHRSRLALLLASSATLGACSPDDAVRPEAARPARITLDADTRAALASLGDTARVTPRVLDQEGRPLAGVALRWSLAPAGVVQRDAEGVYRAVGNGRATIVAAVDVGETGVRADGYWATPVADTVVVEVRQRPARLTLAAVDTAFGTLGALRQLRAEVTDARGNALLDGPPPLTWRAENAAVLAVDGAGVVRSLGEGTSRVTVQADGLAGAATFTVSPRLPHTSCMLFAQRRQTRQACVTLDLVVREREGGR
jgi:hypothetical protein